MPDYGDQVEADAGAARDDLAYRVYEVGLDAVVTSASGHRDHRSGAGAGVCDGHEDDNVRRLQAGGRGRGTGQFSGEAVDVVDACGQGGVDPRQWEILESMTGGERWTKLSDDTWSSVPQAFSLP